jgi:hypothetical protein
MDPRKGDDIWAVWQKLNTDDVYNIQSMAAALVWGADDKHLPRPGLNYSEENSQRVMARYNGPGVEAEPHGAAMIGMYRVFEMYNAPLRA